ncbi:MAG: amino acid synthesis family protein, partial [Actinomycetota bacterium]
MLFPIRKIVTVVEEIHHDLGPAPKSPALKGAVAAVVANPYAGQWVEDLSPAADELRALGERLGNILISHLG